MILSSVSLADEDAETELLALAKEAFDQRLLVKSEEDRVIAFRRVLENHSDEEKIEAIALYLFSTDDDERYRMRSSNAMTAVWSLGQDRDLIQNWSKLRSMIQVEHDPRRFYLLSKLRPWSRDEVYHDFIPEMSHMLFSSGRVAKEEGEYTKPYAHDVSVFVYDDINRHLRFFKADYEPLSGHSLNREPHEKKILHLANWLINNWPGCENLEIPEVAAEPTRHSPNRQQERIRKRPEEAADVQEPASRETSFRWLLVSGAIMFFAALFGFLKNRH